MKLIILNIALVLLLFAGCEKSEILDVEIPYEEYTVVQAELKSGSMFTGVKITRTLPPGEEYILENAELKDVIAYLRIDGLKIIPLHYTSKGIYKSLYEFRVDSGSTYEIFGERGNSRFYASTTIPYPPVAGGPSYNPHTNAIDVFVTPKAKEIYGAVWIIGNYQDMASNYTSLSTPGAINNNMVISTAAIPEKYRTSAYSFLKFVRVYSYDTQFYAFYNSIKNNEPVNNVFLQGGGSISWNVKGNNVIGLFIGTAEGGLMYAQ